MPSPNDNYWYDQGRSGGNRPDNFSSDTATEKYNDGRAQREIDRTTNDALEQLHNPNYDFNDALLPVGATYWVRLVEAFFARE